MKRLWVLLLAAVACAQEPEKYLYTTGLEAVPALVRSKTTKMEVIDRTAVGALVQTYRIERKMRDVTVYIPPMNGPQPIHIESNEPLYRDVRVNGEIIFVRGLANGVGVAVEESTIYETGEDITIKGTVYRVFDVRAPKVATKYVDTTIKSVNPAWTKWAENQRAVAKQRATARIIAYQLDRASNGYPGFQLTLGKRYLNGDGVETNLALARHWLQAACTNGESQASNLLKQVSDQAHAPATKNL